MDRCPPANGGAVHAETLVKRSLAQLIDGIRNVMLQSRQVGEAEVKNLDPILLHKLQDGFRVSHALLLGGIADFADGIQGDEELPATIFRIVKAGSECNAAPAVQGNLLFL